MIPPEAHSEATSSNPPITPAGELLSSSALGFDLREDAWLDLLRDYRSGPGPGRIGPYELLEEIGRGGQGVVYKARQPRTGRTIAIKRVPASGLDGSSFRVRFEREIRALSALDHPHIVSILSCDEIDGQPVLLMEYVEGAAIDRWARDETSRGKSRLGEDTATARPGSDAEPETPGARSESVGSRAESAGAPGLRAILTTFARLCRAVAHAHQRGIIHRDLKPSNVLIDAQGNPHVLDFGLARLLHPLTGDSLSQTHTAGFVGTPIYASPEQFDEDDAAVDVRSDVYAVGVMLYQTITGELPQGSATRWTTLMRAIQEREPKRPSRLRADVDGELDAIMLKALAKERKDRYQTMDALAEDLERYLAGETVLAVPPTMLYQLRKLVRRHKLAFASTLTILILVVAFGVTAGALAVRESRARERESKLLISERDLRRLADERLIEANRAREAEAVEADRARRIVSFMQDFFGTAEYEGGEEPGLTVKEMLDRAAVRLDRGMAAKEPRIEASLRYSLGAAYRRLDLHAQAVTQYELALLLQEEALGPDHPDVAETLSALAMARFSHTGDATAALACCQRALDIERQCPDGESLRLARTIQRKALLLRELERFDEAEGLARDALAMCGRLVPPDDPAVAGAWRCLGWVLRGRGDTGSLEGAAHAFRQALAIQQDRHGENALATADLQFQLGRDLRDLTRICEAIPLLEQALETRRKWFGPDHPFVNHVSETLGNIRFQQGRFDEAALLWQDIQTAQRKRGDAVAPDAARRLALIQIYAGRSDEASRALEESLAPALEAWGEDHLEVADLRLCAGFALCLNKQPSAAEPLFAAAIATLQRLLNQGGKVEVAYVMDQQAFAYVALRDADAAERLLETPAARQALDGPDAKHRARLQTTRGFLFTRRGDYEAAESSLLSALGYFYADRTTHWWYHVLLSELVELYERWGRPDQADAWRERMRRPGGDQYRCP